MPRDAAKPQKGVGVMPKESIYSRDPDAHYRVEVAWQRENPDVMVSVGQAHQLGNGLPVAYVVSLDRAGINRTIRALRKARDQAYGTDA